ncbi:unnamed protein product [Mytilus coruscus]|uniref:Uncharacterized protein n=1 Tax=Mytilus coruscus TaxID=42192 RepID=A0A6J8BM06_MYTCO|nr:unnamed protein product [Mytilus coruscus]
MKIYKQISFTASILSMVSVTSNANIKEKCPSGKHWYLRAKSYCSSVERYTCLLDSVRNIYKENCNGPKTEPLVRDKTVVNSGNFDTESCSLDRFQPFSFSSSQGNECVYKKTMCIEEGQLIYNNGTSRYDRKCKCDYIKKFSFVSTKRVDMCSCDPTTEDCSCYIKHCSKGQILTPDYQCVKIEESYGSFVCGDIGITSGTPTVKKRYEAMRTNIDESVRKNGKRLEVRIVCLAGIFIVGFLCMCLLLPIYETIAKIFYTARSHDEHDQFIRDFKPDDSGMNGNDSEISHSTNKSMVVHKSPANDLSNDFTTTGQIKSNTETVPTLQSSITCDLKQFKGDQNIKTEGLCKYRIHNALVDTYRDQPYEITVLNDLIKDGTIETYDSPENMTELNSVQKEEEMILKNLIIENGRAYTIRRRELKPKQEPVNEYITAWGRGEITKLAWGKFKKLIDWFGYNDPDYERIV